MALAGAALSALYAGLHAWASPLQPMGDVASYLDRGGAFSEAVHRLDVARLVRQWKETGHRPWPGLLGVYVAALLGGAMPLAAALQGAWAGALAGAGIGLLSSSAGVARSWAFAVTALLVAQPLWRLTTAQPFADAVLAGCAVLAIGACARACALRSVVAMRVAGVVLAAATVCKPAGLVWVSLPMGMAMVAWAARGGAQWPARARLVAEFGRAAAVAAPAVLVIGSGPMALANITSHGRLIESLGVYDESVHSWADRALWAALAPVHAATIPLCALALAGWWTWARRAQGTPVPWLAAAAVVPLCVHAFAMDSKSMRLLTTAIAYLAAAAVGAGAALSVRTSRWAAALAAAVWCVLAVADVSQSSSERELADLMEPVGDMAWRTPPLRLVGTHRQADSQWPAAGRALRDAVTANCAHDASLMLFAEPRLAPGGRLESGAGLGITSDSPYVVDTSVRARLDALVVAGGCLVDSDPWHPQWHGGRGRVHAEGLMGRLHRERATGALRGAFEAVSQQALPNGVRATVWRRSHAANLSERQALAHALADEMPKSGALAFFWLEVGRALLQDGQLPQGCAVVALAADSHPLRGQVACERANPGLCAAWLDINEARAVAARHGCAPAAWPGRWPAGLRAPLEVTQGPLPALATHAP